MRDFNIMKYKTGQKVKIIKNDYPSIWSDCARTGESYILQELHSSDFKGKILWRIRKENSDYNYFGTSNGFKLIKGKVKEIMATKNKKAKTEFKIGEVVYNTYNTQKSEVLAVFRDKEDKMDKYVLRCLEDNGSIHLIYEESISKIEVIKVSLKELIESYKENELQDSQEVEVVK